MGKVNHLDGRVDNIVKLSAKYVFKNLNKDLYKSWLREYSVRGHDRVDKCKIQFKEGLPEFVYSPSWLKSLENEIGTFNGSSVIDFICDIIRTQDSKMKSRRGRKRKVALKYSYDNPKVSL